MNFQTSIPFTKQKHYLINYDANLLLVGSCFSENIGAKLNYFKFQSKQNPLGILFHPKAIENLILKAVNKENYTDNDIFFHNERWHSFEAHSSFSSIDKNTLIDNLNSFTQQTYKQLQNTTHLIITLGTAWTYRHIASDTLVANCHKVPQKKF